MRGKKSNTTTHTVYVTDESYWTLKEWIIVSTPIQTIPGKEKKLIKESNSSNADTRTVWIRILQANLIYETRCKNPK